MSRPSFRLQHLIVAAGFLILALAGLFTTGMYFMRSDKTITEARNSIFTPTMGEAHARLDLLFTPADTTLQLVTIHSEKPYFLKTDATTIPTSLTKTLDSARFITSIYTGYDDGQYFMILRSNKQDDIHKMAPDDTAYILHTVTIEEHDYKRLLRFFDKDLNLIKTSDISDRAPVFDPRERPWYGTATQDDALHVTMPYRFASSGEFGISLSRRLQNLDGVAGADINLESLIGALATLKPTPEASIALIDATGNILACSDAKGLARRSEQHPLSCGPLSKATADELVMAGKTAPQSPRFRRIVTDDGAWVAGGESLPELGANGVSMVLAVPEDALVAGLRTPRNDTLLLLAGGFILLLPALFYGAHLVTSPLQCVAREAERGRKFDFTAGESTHSVVTEINDLALSVDHMQHTIRKFMQLAKSVSRIRDFDRLVPLLTQEMQQATATQAVLLYMPDKDHTLRLWSGCGIGGECLGHDESEALPPTTVVPQGKIPIRTGGLPPGDACHRHISTLLNGTDAQHQHWFAAVTLRDKRDAVLGELLVIDRVPFSQERLAFLRATSGVVEVALDNDRMVKTQKELFSAFIRLLAQAIDAKSPYTGGHCTRVPILSRLLAEAASDTRQGAYASFGMTNESWEELYLASWLHDCGKVTTPEFVVDKATKLETIHNRIHEIRTRFEVIKRDAHIAYWKGVSEGGDRAALQKTLQDELRTLDDDFAFVAACNTGEAPVDDAARQRLRNIAERTWERTLDDTLGISWAERERKEPDHPLPPVMEKLLCDSSAFVVKPDAVSQETEDRWGFDMPRPEVLYDRGELHNLSIPWGTLTSEERYKINEHIIQTIMMLSELPFPAHLENVPEIAGGHHERMDGTGYPRRIKGELLHPLARIMAVADIFEALTAPDRPYKKAKTLSQAMNIMVGMAKSGHIDRELLCIFIREEVYRAYAENHLPEWQRDAVDAEALLRDLG